ncbi:S41 family peptidase [Lysinibacillus sp. NPDC096418]|uniref:S41 family peptidase n=1 Tax=Lysinibacillus sp. NPDC096418 TaxID=3364138 RepID=UPI0037FAD2DE
MKKALWSLLFIISLFVLSVDQSSAATNEKLIKEIKEIITENYVGTIDGNLNTAKTIPEIIDMLDPYSTYFTKEEYYEYTNSINLSTTGIGVVIEEHENGINILQVIDGGGAASAGVVAGDTITAINDQSIIGSSIQEVSSLLTGKENTQVKVTLLHEDGRTSIKTITRKKFTLPNVESELLFGDVGYISMSSFSEDGAKLVRNSLTQLKQRGASSFILDLQNNGGGYVTTAEELSGLFPKAKIAYLLEEAHASYEVKAVQQSIKFPANTRVLVNRYSASASEMVAASLQDQKAAILYGETTYGKGAMQGFYELHDGSYLKLTVGKFTGPSGKTIHEKGVIPSIQTKSDPIYKAHYDALKEQFANYQEQKSFKNVSTTKAFTVKFSQKLATTVPKGSVQLVSLGGNEVACTAAVQEDNALLITPTTPLVKGQEYMLLVHPTLQTAKGTKLKQGTYLHIAVAK